MEEIKEATKLKKEGISLLFLIIHFEKINI